LVELLLGISSAVVVGFAKAGLKGTGILAVVLLAIAYGTKASTGIMLPLLIFGDIMAVIYYRRYCKWEYLLKFLPAIVIGVLIAVFLGKDLNEESFKLWLTIIILISVIIVIWREKDKDRTFPNSWWFAGPIGIATGFSTMIGNAAGGFANLFFLATGINKNAIIGTAAWLFFLINLFKVPFHIWSWGTINMQSLLIDLKLLPAVVIGFIIGLKLVALFSEQYFRWFLIFTTALGAVLIMIK